VAELLRRYHDAVGSFDPGPFTWSTHVPAAYRTGTLSHNDPNLDNVVFRDGVAVALIDFDLASPGSALWDIALAARLWVPLRDPSEVPGQIAGREAERLRLVADAYGLTAADRHLLAEAARATHTWCYDIVRQGARQGRPGYAHYWTPAAQEHDVRGQRWLEANQDRLSAALC
jgi:Ser/Thr protein kinase RdoA (MazF antagonist)